MPQGTTATDVDREEAAALGHPLAGRSHALEVRVAELTAALRERDLLLREVHHRVKNDMGAVAGLINLTLRALPPGPTRDALEECRARVGAIALVHEQLGRTASGALVPFSQYARHLAARVFEATGLSPERVSLRLVTRDVALPADMAVPCGLILNELMTNALKHAFRDGRQGTLRMELLPLPDDGMRLVVADDGVGLPEGFDLRNARSVGLQLVGMLVKQLGAELEAEVRDGTTFRLTVRGRD